MPFGDFFSFCCSAKELEELHDKVFDEKESDEQGKTAAEKQPLLQQQPDINGDGKPQAPARTRKPPRPQSAAEQKLKQTFQEHTGQSYIPLAEKKSSYCCIS